MEQNARAGIYNEATKELNLTQQHLEAVPTDVINGYGGCTEYLDLSRNRISKLDWIYRFDRLKVLILDSNRLHEGHFRQLKKPMESLRVLILNKNDFSDLHTTVNILSSLFPNLEYLSLHGNPICPDGLELMPFCHNISYEYDYYRTVILNSFNKLKFLDHSSAQLRHISPSDLAQEQARILTFTPKMLWAKMKGFLPSKTLHPLPNYNNENNGQHCGTIRKLSVSECIYKGTNSEGNRFISNNDL
ncbi:leucine-rich melanocyte differentiation-associated protein-like [Teleopsis dalmanni]|uniref:leucine-rich melanocyte differentiation-associated protein-like n=1 Tax=Teleopsis dalmanni TaxID=139649 RepID=UPI0018CE3485|nr:leucine-rich melanocyte differentiation-associated protein-like [Teleopsis dalmanni]XP_037951746.1 leucine-rich melanocyte differentiation-associated protein-like [Teleopsis dalmanni]